MRISSLFYFVSVAIRRLMIKYIPTLYGKFILRDNDLVGINDRIRYAKVGFYKGYTFIVAEIWLGHRCGYVHIPDGHRLDGLSYRDTVPTPKDFDADSATMGRRNPLAIICAMQEGWEEEIALDLLFDVHGSITFGGRLLGFEGWWLGFDCGHDGDKPDPSIATINEARKYLDLMDSAKGEIRSEQYVIDECKSLIDQIITIYDK